MWGRAGAARARRARGRGRRRSSARRRARRAATERQDGPGSGSVRGKGGLRGSCSERGASRRSQRIPCTGRGRTARARRAGSRARAGRASVPDCGRRHRAAAGASSFSRASWLAGRHNAASLASDHGSFAVGTVATNESNLRKSFEGPGSRWAERCGTIDKYLVFHSMHKTAVPQTGGRKYFPLRIRSHRRPSLDTYSNSRDHLQCAQGKRNKSHHCVPAALARRGIYATAPIFPAPVGVRLLRPPFVTSFSISPHDQTPVSGSGQCACGAAARTPQILRYRLRRWWAGNGLEFDSWQRPPHGLSIHLPRSDAVIWKA